MADRRGFTLIELMVVTVIMGLLASLAVPRYALFKQRALTTAMVSDLRHVAEAEEGFLFTYGDYAGSIGPFEVAGSGGGGSIPFVPSEGVVITLSYHGGGGSTGWSATAHHNGMSATNADDCGIFMGDLSNAPNVAVTAPGVVACW
jgi:prepilin-type N-terminal cleavage/methylation domain-containing protein